MLILLLVFFTQLFYDCLSHWYVDVMPKEVKAHCLRKFWNAYYFTCMYWMIIKNNLLDIAHKKVSRNIARMRPYKSLGLISKSFLSWVTFRYRHLLLCSPLILILLKVRVLAFASPSNTYGKLQLWRWLNERQRERKREREREWVR